MDKGRIVIKRMQRKKNDYSLDLEWAVHVRFMNRGQTPVLVDDQIMILPGESYVEGDTYGPGLDHPYKIEFQDAGSDGGSTPTENIPFVYPGNHLDIRLMYRKK
ncbi:MAG: hypothetical protein AAFQ37_04805 [Bacteroidota bacterium]